MTWTAKEDGTKIYSGPYLIGVGVAASEESVGECDELRLKSGYSLIEVNGGAFFGRKSLIDAIVDGLVVGGTFLMMQTSSVDLERVMALSTLSTGSTSKSLTLKNATICGKSLLASAERIRFHKYSQSTLTTETEDIIFPKGIIIPAEEEFRIDGGEGATKIPCILLAFYDSSTGGPIVYGINAA